MVRCLLSITHMHWTLMLPVYSQAKVEKVEKQAAKQVVMASRHHALPKPVSNSLLVVSTVC